MKRLGLLYAAMLALLMAGCMGGPQKPPRQRLPNAASTSTPAAQPPASPAPELVEVRVLLVSYQGAQNAQTAQTRTKEQALERARMIARMARSGDRLSELVRKYSELPGASADYGLFRIRPAQPGAFGSEVAEAAVALKPGTISDPVEAPLGYFVIERRTDPPGGPARVAARHILVSYKGAPHAVAGVTRSEAEARTLATPIGGRSPRSTRTSPDRRRREEISASSAAGRWSLHSRTRPSRCRSGKSATWCSPRSGST
jgi:hypothetical protein